MRFRDDTRGVTVQIGAVLLFATIIIALATYQATVVPAQNADVEYQHSQTAQNQLTDVRNALLRTAASGNSLPASVTLGTQYPSRVFLVNPPPAAGSLGTEQYDGNSTISVSNVNATDEETADFFAANGNAWSASTKYLAYQPGYHEYDGAPNLLFEATVLSNHYPDQNASVPLTDQILVDGDTITLVALNGSMSTSRVGSVSVDTTPVSAPYTAVQVEPENDGEPVNVTVPTHVDADTLANATNLRDRENVTVTDAGDGRVSIELSGDGPFTLKTAKLGVGSDVADESARYLTADGDRVVHSGETFTVAVRDRFNNPVRNTNVDVTVDDASLVADGDGERSVSSSGRATFTYTGSGENVTASILGGGAAELEVEFDGRADSDEGSGTGGSTLAWNTSRIESENSGLGMTCWADNITCEYTRPDAGQDSVSLFAAFADGRAYADVDFAANNTSIVSDLNPSADESGEDGGVRTNATVSEAGTALVYAASAGSEDVLRLRAAASGDATGSDPSVSITDISSVGNSGKFDVSWTAGANGDGDLSSVNVTAEPVFSGETLTELVSVSGESASGTTRLNGQGGTWYFVTVTVTDADGRTASETQFHAN